MMPSMATSTIVQEPETVTAPLFAAIEDLGMTRAAANCVTRLAQFEAQPAEVQSVKSARFLAKSKFDF